MQVDLNVAQLAELPIIDYERQKWLTMSVAGPDYDGCRFRDGTRFAPHCCFQTKEEADEWVRALTSHMPRQAPILTLPMNFAIVLARKQENLTCAKYQSEKVKDVLDRLNQWKETQKKLLNERKEKIKERLTSKSAPESAPEIKQAVLDKQDSKPPPDGKVVELPFIHAKEFALVPEVFRNQERSCVLMTCIYKIGTQLLDEPLVIFHLFMSSYQSESDAIRICKRWQQSDPFFWLGRTLAVANCHTWMDGYPTPENSYSCYGTYKDRNDSPDKQDAR